MGHSTHAAVAIVGMACRLPGNINSPRELWEALVRGEDLITDVPIDRWDVEELYHAGDRGRSVSRWGGFVDDVAAFDAEFFGFDDDAAAAVDPQHRLLLETAWEAVERAGVLPASLVGSKTGVFVGLSHSDYLLLARDAGALQGQHAAAGCADSMASARIATALGSHGPAMTVDTSSSSGLTAVHMACRSLLSGESDLALAGCASVLLEPMSQTSDIVSPTGRSRSFDTAADGVVRSEGSAVVVLKRLCDALRDGDRVVAIIRGTAMNHGGRNHSPGMPSEDALEAAYRAALAAAGVDGATVGVVEADGLGLPSADAAEYRSLARVYGIGRPCAVGSAKSNIGHTEAAAGLVGLIKAALQLEHCAVAPMLHFSDLGDDLSSIDTGLFVPQAVESIPTDGQTPPRAAVSSYGLSGTSVHAILEQAPHAAERTEAPGSPLALMYPLSAGSVEELRKTALRLADWWAKTGPDEVAPQDLAYTLARRRGHRAVRAAVITATADRAELSAALRAVAEGDLAFPAKVGRDDTGPVWVFSDDHTELLGNAAGLLATEPVFASTVATLEPLVEAEAGFSVTDAISTGVSGVEKVQPALFAIQVAMAAAMAAHGVRPAAVIGHSTGEVAAAVVAGALSIEDGVTVICRRSALLAGIVEEAARAAVELPAAQVLSELGARGVSDVGLSVVASPVSTLISGSPDSIRELLVQWNSRGVVAEEIGVGVASHSACVDPVLDEFEQALADIEPLEATVPFYSATSYDPRDTPICDAMYWADNLRHTVRFSAAVHAAIEDGHRVFAELSPHPSLAQAVVKTGAALGESVVMTDPFGNSGESSHGLLDLLAALFCAGAAIDFSADNPDGRLVDAPLPSWNHRTLLLDRTRADNGSGRTVAVHPLLGPGVRLPEEPERHVWAADVGLVSHPFFGDHVLSGRVVLPTAAYCEMALGAAKSIIGDGAEVRDLSMRQVVVLGDDTLVSATATADGPGGLHFTVETHTAGDRKLRATAVLHSGESAEVPPAHDVTALLAAHPMREEGAAVRKRMDARGIGLGPAFSGLAAVFTADAGPLGPGATVLAEIDLPDAVRSNQAGYTVHPAALDVAFQAIAAAVDTDAIGVASHPVAVSALRAYDSARAVRYCYARVVGADADGVRADLELLDAHGNVRLAVTGLRFGPVFPDESADDRLLGENLLTIEWVQRHLPASYPVDAGSWLVIKTSGNGDMMAHNLTDALKLHGGECATMVWPRQADHVAAAQVLRAQLDEQPVAGVVMVTVPRGSDESGVGGGEYVGHLLRIVRELAVARGEQPRVYVLTRGVQTVLPNDVANLEQAGLRGLTRVIGSEYPHLRATQIDVDEATDSDHVARQLLTGTEDDETAWRGGRWYTARLRPAPIRAADRRVADLEHDEDGMRVEIRTAGDLDSLELVALDRVAPGAGQIEVAVTASGLDFADVLVAQGRHPGTDGEVPRLGIDFVGVVTAVGPGVTGRSVGDRVGGIHSEGCWASFVVCDAATAVTLPASLADADAAAVTTPYATAWYALHDLARTGRGDKVLIHSATGPAGRAAIAIARAARAQIYATASTEQRRELLREWGVEYVYDSTDTAFADQIRLDTAGSGVDVVLNTLSGSAQRASLDLLAVGGRFVEMGTRNIYSDNSVLLSALHRNLSFYALDLARLAAGQPARVAEVLDTVYRLLAEGSLPMSEVTRFPLNEAATAIELMDSPERVGKMVLDIPRSGRSRAVVRPEHVPVFRTDGAYIVTGGSAGIGLFLAERMVESGCGRVVLGQQPDAEPAPPEVIDRMRRQGADVFVVCGDVGDARTVDSLVAVAGADGMPIRGVLHAVSVADDTPVVDITDALVEQAWAPKVRGAWRLHEATAAQPLDWFCVFSSAAALSGWTGHGAPVAADSWLEAFTHWRRANGLPATTIAWGDWAGLIGPDGVATEGAAIQPDEGAYVFESLLRHDRPYNGYAPFIGRPWMTALAQRSLFADLCGENGRAATRLRAELDALPEENWPTVIRQVVGEQVSLQLRCSVEPDRALPEYGLDSLGNLELRGRIKAKAGVQVSATEITTIDALVAILCERLRPEADD